MIDFLIWWSFLWSAEFRVNRWNGWGIFPSNPNLNLFILRIITSDRWYMKTSWTHNNSKSRTTIVCIKCMLTMKAPVNHDFCCINIFLCWTMWMHGYLYWCTERNYAWFQRFRINNWITNSYSITERTMWVNHLQFYSLCRWMLLIKQLMKNVQTNMR